MRPDSDEPADRDLRAILEMLDPLSRDALRRVLIHDQADRDAISCRLMRYRDQNGQDRADIIDFLTMEVRTGWEGPPGAGFRDS